MMYVVFSIIYLAVERFPLIERDAREPNTNSIERVRGSGPIPSNIKLQDHNHNREVIFALPSLQLHFKSEHFQPANIDIRRKLKESIITFPLFHSLTSQFSPQKKNLSLNVVS